MNTAHQRIHLLVAAAALLLASGCPARGGRETVRLVDGKPQPGRYVSPGAYEHYLRSQIALHKGDLRVAAAETRSAQALDPRSPFLHIHLARIQIRNNKLEAGRRELKLALELQPDSARDPSRSQASRGAICSPVASGGGRYPALLGLMASFSSWNCSSVQL